MHDLNKVKENEKKFPEETCVGKLKLTFALILWWSLKSLGLLQAFTESVEWAVGYFHECVIVQICKCRYSRNYPLEKRRNEMNQQIIGNSFHLTIRILSPEILFKQILLK